MLVIEGAKLPLKEMQARAEVEVVDDDGNCNEAANVAYLFGLGLGQLKGVRNRQRSSKFYYWAVRGVNCTVAQPLATVANERDTPTPTRECFLTVEIKLYCAAVILAPLNPYIVAEPIIELRPETRCLNGLAAYT